MTTKALYLTCLTIIASLPSIDFLSSIQSNNEGFLCGAESLYYLFICHVIIRKCHSLPAQDN